MIHLVLAASFWHDILHPLGYCTGTPSAVSACRGYNAHSGVLANFGELSIFVAIIGSLLAYLRKHNCHVPGCPWIEWHPHPLHGHPVCRKHWLEEGAEHGLEHPHHGLHRHYNIEDIGDINEGTASATP